MLTEMGRWRGSAPGAIARRSAVLAVAIAVALSGCAGTPGGSKPVAPGRSARPSPDGLAALAHRLEEVRRLRADPCAAVPVALLAAAGVRGTRPRRISDLGARRCRWSAGAVVVQASIGRDRPRRPPGPKPGDRTGVRRWLRVRGAAWAALLGTTPDLPGHHGGRTAIAALGHGGAQIEVAGASPLLVPDEALVHALARLVALAPAAVR